MAYFLDGATYIYMVASPQVVIAAWALKLIDDRANVEKFVKLRDEMALDAYVFTREGWRQSRVYSIYDGHPPETSSDEEDDFGDDEFSDDEFGD
jgi:phospholipid-binding lipoprotein MlaA